MESGSLMTDRLNETVANFGPGARLAVARKPKPQELRPEGTHDFEAMIAEIRRTNSKDDEDGE
ncbi:hypothetical protein GCM10009836_52150 [Pseudonocardia ailaonensis]|uniref:Prevent-host-death protein n=1 Tax=Pseudonocardia ailaonensis TaxID=367279 RepID=A0ABN2NE64_9PSEU